MRMCSSTTHERSANADCFLRHMHEFEYISNIDIDEVIVPMANSSSRDWPSMIERIEANIKEIKTTDAAPRNSFKFPHFAFFTSGLKRDDPEALA